LRYAIAAGCLFGFVGMCIVAAAYILCEKFGLLKFSDPALPSAAFSNERSIPTVADHGEQYLGHHSKTSLMSPAAGPRLAAKNRSSD
jgi:hypothetical protein